MLRTILVILIPWDVTEDAAATARLAVSAELRQAIHVKDPFILVSIQSAILVAIKNCSVLAIDCGMVKLSLDAVNLFALAKTT